MLKKSVAILLVAFVMVIFSSFSVQLNSEAKEMKIFGDFSIFDPVIDHNYPIIVHSVSEGITIYRVIYDDETKEVDLVFDDEGNPVVCHPTDDDFIDNLLWMFDIHTGCDMYVKGLEDVSIFYFGFPLPEDHRCKGCSVHADYDQKDSTYFQLYPLLSVERQMINREDISLGSIFFMDENFNYACYKYTGNDLCLYEQKALNPDIDYGKYPTLFKPTTAIPWQWFSESSVTKGYIWLRPYKAAYLCGTRVRLAPASIDDSGIMMVDPDWFIQSVYGLWTLDSEYGDPYEYTLYRLRNDLYSDNPELIKAYFKEGSDIAVINDNSEYKLSTQTFSNKYLVVPLIDLCNIFKLKYHYRPFDQSILIERFR